MQDASAINTAGYPLTPSVHPSVCLPALLACLRGCGSMTSASLGALADLCHHQQEEEEEEEGGGGSGASSRQPCKRAGNKQLSVAVPLSERLQAAEGESWHEWKSASGDGITLNVW